MRDDKYNIKIKTNTIVGRKGAKVQTLNKNLKKKKSR